MIFIKVGSTFVQQTSANGMRVDQWKLTEPFCRRGYQTAKPRPTLQVQTKFPLIAAVVF